MRKKTSSDLTLEEYIEEVYYCKSCHSLYIIGDETIANEDWDGSYCGKCNSTDIATCAFGVWMEEEERRAKVRAEIEWNK